MSDYRRDRDRKDRDYDRDNKRKRDDRDDRDRDRDRERERDRDRDRDDRRDRRDRDSSSKRKRDDRSKSPEDDRRRGSERDGSHSETPKESRRSEEREMKTDSNGKKDVKKTPMDVEDLIKKKQEEENKSKPVFLSKEERAKLALARRAAEVEEKMKKLEEQKKSREKFFQEAESTPLSEDKLRERERDRERERERERRERERERKEKEKREKEEKEKEKKEDAIDPKELELLKQSYLGGKKEKKKIIKPSEKFKFVFDWDEGEDTSKDLNPLYSTKVDIKPQFGRGNFGGLEIKDSDDKKKSKMDDIDKPLRHWSEKTLEEMTPRDWRIFKEDNNVSTKGGNLPHPIRNWKEAGFRKEVLDALEKSGYKTPTPIQMQAIPVALQGRDVMGIAETGSGKTCAFVLPMLEYILKLPPMTPATELEGPYALIMAPTRELATQIEQETRKFAAPCGIRCQCVVGGTSIEEQALQLRKGVEVIIATPGRLVDLVDSRFLALNQCTYIVLDEADRMIDMGFEPQVNKILDAMPVTNLKSEDDSLAEQQENDAVRGRYRTTIMYSATMPTGVERLSRKYLRRPAYVIIGEVGKAVDRIKQNIEFIKDDGYKMKRVTQLLEEGPPPPIIIFVNHKKSADGIAKQLEKFGFRAVTLHSSKSQWQREAAIEGFKSGKYDILVATDVAGRGIDVKGVTHIINYDMPTSIENYTHRIGRTGRAGAEGLATSFVTNDDSAVFYDLKQMLTATNNQIPQELAQHPASSVKPGSEQAMKPRRDTIIYAKK